MSTYELLYTMTVHGWDSLRMISSGCNAIVAELYLQWILVTNGNHGRSLSEIEGFGAAY